MRDQGDDLGASADEALIARRLSHPPRRCGFYIHTDGAEYHLVGCDARLLDLHASCECDTFEALSERLGGELGRTRRRAEEAEKAAATWMARALRAEAVIRAALGIAAVDVLGHVVAGGFGPPSMRRLRQIRAHLTGRPS